jgi:uncharacterized protein
VSGYPVPIRARDALDDVLPPEYVIPISTVSKMLTARPDGTCPLLVEHKCTIYTRRPQTCRDYDCRVFAAAGIDAGGEEREVINRRVRAWQFTYESEGERRVHDAIKTTACFIRQNSSAFAGRAPTAASGIAVLSVKSFEVFLNREPGTRSAQDLAADIVAASRKFDLAV